MPALPKPAQPPPVIVGGKAEQHARAGREYATEFNSHFRSPAVDSGEQFDRVRAAVVAHGRDAGEMVLLPRDHDGPWVADDAEVARRAAAIGREVADLKQNGAPRGHPGGGRRHARPLRPRPARRGPTSRSSISTDLDHLELIASAVAPQLR